MEKINKSKAVYGIEIEMINIVKEIIVIASKPISKYNKVNLNRSFKIIALTLKIKMLRSELHFISLQPNFKPGGTIIGNALMNKRNE